MITYKADDDKETGKEQITIDGPVKQNLFIDVSSKSYILSLWL